MYIYDVLFILSESLEILQIEWGNPEAEELYHLLFQNWASRRRHITSVFPIDKESISGDFIWDDDLFDYERRPAPDNHEYFFLKKQNQREYLLGKALDHVQDGIQIYDKNACAVFFNIASRKISQIPPNTNIRGRHLLDMYNLKEEISTIMTSLRTQSPVINRVDHYTSSNGVTIATANTAYPIIKGGKLLGAVVFEQNQDIVDIYKNSVKKVEKALSLYEKHSHYTRFTGYTFDNIVGHGEKLRNAVEIANKVAKQDSSILLVGETGTGKEVFAQSIHHASRRSSKPFIGLNCAAIPESLIESLLFGTKKGSFTGSEDKPGYFEEANGGTLFLDELNSMSLGMQSKILRVIQENTFRRVGGQKDIPLDVRIISSCNEDPFRSIAENKFRKDLFYRLSTVMIDLPSLREHMEDLEELIHNHLSATAFQYVHAITDIHPEALRIMKNYSWPGNVRELHHVLDYAQNVADSNLLMPEHLPTYLKKNRIDSQTSDSPHPTPSSAPDFAVQDLQSLMDDYENQILRQALEHFGYNITKTADALGLRRQSLQYRIKKYGIII